MIKFSSKNKSMVIVCGGKGKRMGKVLKKIPKAMIKLDNKTIIEHKYDKKVTGLYLVRIHPDDAYKNYERVQVPFLDKEINNLLEYRKTIMS